MSARDYYIADIPKHPGADGHRVIELTMHPNKKGIKLAGSRMARADFVYRQEKTCSYAYVFKNRLFNAATDTWITDGQCSEFIDMSRKLWRKSGKEKVGFFRQRKINKLKVEIAGLKEEVRLMGITWGMGITSRSEHTNWDRDNYVRCTTKLARRLEWLDILSKN
jgi:hypothetical protein